MTDIVERLRAKTVLQTYADGSALTYDAHPIGVEAADEIQKCRSRIAELERALDAFHKNPENPDATVLRYKAIASKAINEQVEIREENEARIAELEAQIVAADNYLEEGDVLKARRELMGYKND